MSKQRLHHPDLVGLDPKVKAYEQQKRWTDFKRQDPAEERRLREKNTANKRRSRAAQKQRALENAGDKPPPKRRRVLSSRAIQPNRNDVENVENTAGPSNASGEVPLNTENTAGPSSHVSFDDTFIDPTLLQQPDAQPPRTSPPPTLDAEVTTRDVCIMTDIPSPSQTPRPSSPVTTHEVCVMTDSPPNHPPSFPGYPSPPSPALSDLTDIESLDLATPIIGSQVHENSPTVAWQSGTTTVLPYIYKDGKNVLQRDADAVAYISALPESCPDSSKYVVHLHYSDWRSKPRELREIITAALCQNKAVVLRQCDQATADELDLELLYDWGASGLMRVVIHDAEQRTKDFTYPQQHATLEQFMRNIHDPNKIQCILDVPLSQGGLPFFLSSLDSGIVDGWNQSTNDCPVGHQVHPDNFTVRSWGLLAKPGWFTYFHHDADGGCTFIYGVVGTKQWTVANLKNQDTISQTSFAKAARLLGTFPENRDEIAALWDMEVITVGKGDLLIQPPGQFHAVYSPAKAFFTGGHFYNRDTHHLSKNSRHLDNKHGKYLTNQIHSHSLETFQRLVMNLPRLSRRTKLYTRPLMALCLMVLDPGAYAAAGAEKRELVSGSTNRASAIATAIVNHFWTNLKTEQKLYRTPKQTAGSQGIFGPGDLIDRDQLTTCLRSFTAIENS
ncbi:hypothetical protein DFJ58DRAFT_774419 [Suillus subalutaceus]|uniref:uncharacterized protein n=1 Tax=Suillus subalutaceus TaxID=48586 RepID=UPI001B85DDCB|nr:uncharacterized protein DFJ58DRAFT_774419 [Suillus subalutaceus]KAG1863213.1 hypothetical protein DFJ58DRAFT_774419 [Suillus subalutaceus]